MVVLNRNAIDVWETPPIVKLDDQQGIANLQYHYVARLYYAIAVPLPKLVSAVSGTGLIPQAGW